MSSDLTHPGSVARQPGTAGRRRGLLFVVSAPSGTGKTTVAERLVQVVHRRDPRAAAKGSTLLNVFGLDGSLIDFVVDRSPHKQGRYMPGVHLPIYPPAHLLATQPEYVLLLSWNVADEVLTQQAEYRGRGGHFIVPVPTVRIV